MGEYRKFMLLNHVANVQHLQRGQILQNARASVDKAACGYNHLLQQRTVSHDERLTRRIGVIPRREALCPDKDAFQSPQLHNPHHFGEHETSVPHHELLHVRERREVERRKRTVARGVFNDDFPHAGTDHHKVTNAMHVRFGVAAWERRVICQRTDIYP